MPLAAGTRIGHLEVLDLIGEGGMGEVYRARDAKLNRYVALKAMPAAVARDPERRARFSREAQVLATLNHPNIASIYGLEDYADGQVIVMELVEGPTIEDRLRSGPIPIDETIKIARQICEALEAAHEKNIIHRDLKPANIKVTADSVVKVLDFGLARAMDQASTPGNSETSPTLTMAAIGGMTGAGVILGTAAYMSPEQARGAVADRRADIWSFGVVLYEMLTGKRAFTGETVSDVMAAVLTRDPDFTILPADTPPWLARLVRRCLTRDRKQRLQAIGEARLTIDEKPAESSITLAPVQAATSTASKWRWLAAGVALVIASGAAGFFLRPATSPAESYQLAIEPPPDSDFTFGNVRGGGAISPDGMLFVFTATTGTKQQLWVRPMDSYQARPLDGTDRPSHPFWSPDSRWIGFFADGKLRKVPAAGGPVEILADAASPRGGTWNSDGVILFTPGTGSGGFIHRIPAAGGTATPLPVPPEAKDEIAHYWPQFFDGGRKFLYAMRKAQIEWTLYAASLDKPLERVKISPTFSQGYVAPGRNGSPDRLVWMRDRKALVAQPFDAGKLQLAGEAAVLMADPDYVSVVARGNFSVSETGSLVLGTGSSRPTELQVVTREGADAGTISEPGLWVTFRISPDGRKLIASKTGEGDDLWLIDIERKLTSRFTFDGLANNVAAWSPDGKWIAYNNASALRRKETSGAGRVETLREQGRSLRFPMNWTPDGKWLVLQSGGNLVLAPAEGKSEDKDEKPLLAEKFAEFDGQVSPNGKWIAYTSDESGETQVFVQSFPGLGGKTQVSYRGGRHPAWRADNRELFFVGDDSRMMAASIAEAGSGLTAGSPQALFRVDNIADASMAFGGAQFAVLPDGRRFVVRRSLPGEGRRSMKLLLNWQSALGK